MNQPVARLEQPQRHAVAAANDFFSSLEQFQLLQRMGDMFSKSDMVPAQYRNNIANCAIAIDLAQRIGASPIAVMQNMTPVEGKPAWSSQFIIASINSTGKFSPLRFEMSDPGEEETVEYVKHYRTVKGEGGRDKKEPVKDTISIRDRECYAWVVEKASGQKLKGTPISIKMAVREGWYTKNGSKWKTMEEQMLCYRAAAFFGRLYSPEVMMGMPTVEEVYDVYDAAATANGVYEVPTQGEDQAAGGPEGNVTNLNAKLKQRGAAMGGRRSAGAETAASTPVAPAASDVPAAAESQQPAAAETVSEGAPAKPAGEAAEGVVTIEAVCAALNKAADADQAADVLNENLKSLPKDQQQIAKDKFKETLDRLRKEKLGGAPENDMFTDDKPF